MSEADAEYRLSPEAERDMQSIWTHTLEQWGREQADRYTDELIAGFKSLAAFPMSGQSIDHIRKGFRRMSMGRHGIYFRVTDYGVAIIRVLHDRMLPTLHLAATNGE